ncbi:hypothetical protein [Labilibaculum antarcticum]|nr:hypothetical protein [Labilibaculum antarcticum]
MKRIIYLLLISLYCLSSCQKTEYQDVSPKLEITVNDNDGNFISNVTVTLYTNESGWKNKTNDILEAETNSSGIVLFEELEEQIYYFSAVKGDLTNDESSVATLKPLAINTKAQITLIIK